MGTELEAHLDAVNPGLTNEEKIQFLVVVKDEWLPENGYLTPTNKIKRSVIEEAYDSNVAGWYEKGQKVIWHGFE